MSIKLPPMTTLRLFEAAARLQSFRLAAEEVHLTPSAVSHGIQTLETWLGTELFLRGPKGISLTAVGEAYYPEVRRALSILAAATEQLPGRRAEGNLSASIAPTFASRWLMPRLHRFVEQYPDLRLSLDTSPRVVDFATSGVDLAIRMATSAGRDGEWTELVAQTLVPVCSPALRARLSGLSGADIFGHAPLIHVTSVSEDWEAWFASAHMTPPTEGGDIRVDTIGLAVEAAVRGLGIVLGRRPLLDADIERGDLVPLDLPEVPGATSYWLVGRPGAFARGEVKLFRDWLLAELGTTATERST
jgi:DNA-binding transcriptional LysR family regulator